MAQLNLGPLDDRVRLGGLARDGDTVVRRAQQMLLAAALAGLGILGVAAVMMLRLF